MKLPTIHLNGTSATSLRDGYHAAYVALGAALKALNETYPHGRDYYPQGDDALGAALSSHRARVADMTRIHAELGALYAHCEEMCGLAKSRAQ